MKKIKNIILLATITILCSVSPLFADIEDTVRNQIPASYYSRCEKEGRTDLFSYKTPRQIKTAVVYTPYGYDETDKDTRYPVLFLMHGGGGSAANYLGPAKSPNSLCWIIDNMINEGVIEPLIVVCPNHNGSFNAELRNSLIPAIDEAYNTRADRYSRAIGGFSMGSVATWDVYRMDLDLVNYYIPMCGDSWVCGQTGGKNYPDQTASILAKANLIEEYSDFKIFAATGDKDIAYPNLTPQIQAMKKLSEVFTYTTENFEKGNLIYYVVQGYVHSYNHTYEAIYNALSLFFPGK